MFELCGTLSLKYRQRKAFIRKRESYQEEGTRFKRCMLAKTVYAASS